MSFQSLLLWPENPGLSIVVLVVVAVGFMYAARRPVHELLRALGHMIGGPLRIAARSLAQAAADIHHRNKAVLLAHGRQEVGSRVEREFERLAAIVTRDLQGYPTLQRKLLDEITKIEEDYKKCGEVPPPSPDWTDAVAAIANVKSTGNELVLRVLEEIKRSVSAIHDKALREYRKSYETRHKILEGFMPFWRSVDKNLTQVEKNLASLQSSVSSVDAHMAKYEAINAATDKAQHALTVSAFTQFFISLLVTLAGVEAALALMRDMLIADKQALLLSLATVQAGGPAEGWVGRIPTAGQMLLGFILPFALAFIAIPLESLIHSARTVGGVVLIALVRALAVLLRVSSQVVRQGSRVLVRLYDVAIVVPLLAERFARQARRPARGRGAHDFDAERTHA